MDLNEKLAARRRELAEQEKRERIEAQQQRIAEQQAIQNATSQAAKAKDAAEVASLTRQAPTTKVVDIDDGVQLFKDAVERTTKKQMAILFVMTVLAIIGLSKDILMATFWAVCAIGYITVTIASHAEDIRQPNKKK